MRFNTQLKDLCKKENIIPLTLLEISLDIQYHSGYENDIPKGRWIEGLETVLNTRRWK